MFNENTKLKWYRKEASTVSVSADTVEIENPLKVKERNRKLELEATDLLRELDLAIIQIETRDNIAKRNIAENDTLGIMASAIESVAEFFGISLLDLK